MNRKSRTEDCHAALRAARTDRRVRGDDHAAIPVIPTQVHSYIRRGRLPGEMTTSPSWSYQRSTRDRFCPCNRSLYRSRLILLTEGSLASLTDA